MEIMNFYTLRKFTFVVYSYNFILGIFLKQNLKKKYKTFNFTPQSLKKNDNNGWLIDLVSVRHYGRLLHPILEFENICFTLK